MTGRLLFAATAFAAVAIAAILGFLVWFSLPVFESGALRSTLAWNWRPLQGEFGILPAGIDEEPAAEGDEIEIAHQVAQVK